MFFEKTIDYNHLMSSVTLAFQSNGKWMRYYTIPFPNNCGNFETKGIADKAKPYAIWFQKSKSLPFFTDKRINGLNLKFHWFLFREVRNCPKVIPSFSFRVILMDYPLTVMLFYFAFQEIEWEVENDIPQMFWYNKEKCFHIHIDHWKFLMKKRMGVIAIVYSLIVKIKNFQWTSSVSGYLNWLWLMSKRMKKVSALLVKLRNFIEMEVETVLFLRKWNYGEIIIC
jgi:hypothetical protein